MERETGEGSVPFFCKVKALFAPIGKAGNSSSMIRGFGSLATVKEPAVFKLSEICGFWLRGKGRTRSIDLRYRSTAIPFYCPDNLICVHIPQHI